VERQHRRRADAHDEGTTMSRTDLPRPSTTSLRTAALTMPLTAAASSAAGALLLRAATTLRAEARSSYGTEALTALVLLAVAVLGVALCAYLALVHVLAAVVMLRGADAAGSRALLGALRVLAPRLAARALTTLAVTTAAAGLLAGPAQAQSPPVGATSAAGSASASASSAPAPSAALAPLMRLPDAREHQHGPTGASRSAQLPAEPGATSPDDPAAQTETPSAPPAGGTAGTGDGELPGLGWGDQETLPDAHTSVGPQDAPTEDSGGSPAGSDDRPDTLTVVVEDGDSLWSISDDVLGVGADDPADIAEAWPQLYAANVDAIGGDPDRIEPGQVLTVPDTLPTSQEK
jgi:nucleoid-associated protein YgaU